MQGLSWWWILVMAMVPLPAAILLAAPIWRRGEAILGNIAGTVVILGAAFTLIFREWAELDVIERACLDTGVVCFPVPPAFMRYAIYASLGLLETLALFAISLTVERRLREQRYAPEWRR